MDMVQTVAVWEGLVKMVVNDGRSCRLWCDMFSIE